MSGDGDQSRPLRRSGITRSVRVFFRDNPEEELTFADMTTKFEVSLDVAYRIVDRLSKEGLLESVRVIRIVR